MGLERKYYNGGPVEGWQTNENYFTGPPMPPATSSTGSGQSASGFPGGHNWLTGTYQTGQIDPTTGMPITGSTGVSGATGIGQMVGGIADLIGSKKRISDYQKDKRKAGQKIKDFYNAAEAGEYNYSLDRGYSDMYEMSKTKTSRDPFERATAAGLNTLQSQGGTRGLLAGLSPFMQNMAMGETQLGLTDLQREMTGLGQLTQARAGITAQNEALRNQLAMRQLEQNELAKATATQNIAAEKQAKRDAWGNIASGALQTGLSFVNPMSMMGEDGMKVPKQQYNKGGAMRYQMGGDVLSQIMGGQGGLPPVQGPLPGEASHETNPIHMLNNNGEKVGEAMGGEFIVNAEQASEMTEEYKEIKAKIDAGEKIGEEEWMELFKTIDSIFGQPQFNDSEMAEQPMS